MSRSLPCFFVLTCGLWLAGCGAASQKPVLQTALENDETRKQSFEATLRVLDEHPEYVDELFALTLRHPRVLDRFLQNSGRELAQDEFARRTAFYLVQNPTSVQQTMIATLDAASDKPPALDGIAAAMAARPQLAAITITQREEAMRKTITQLIREVQKNPKARKAFLVSLTENSEPLASLIARNPEVLTAYLKALVKEGALIGNRELKTRLESEPTTKAK